MANPKVTSIGSSVNNSVSDATEKRIVPKGKEKVVIIKRPEKKKTK